MTPTARRFVFVGAPTIAGLLLAGFLTWLLWPTTDLRQTDPHGAAACETLADWLNGAIAGDDTDIRLGVGEDAYLSETPGIKATGKNASEGTVFEKSNPLYVARLETLYTACEDAGVDMPNPNGKITPE